MASRKKIAKELRRVAGPVRQRKAPAAAMAALYDLFDRSGTWADSLEELLVDVAQIAPRTAKRMSAFYDQVTTQELRYLEDILDEARPRMSEQQAAEFDGYTMG